jgi:hypothetical protein
MPKLTFGNLKDITATRTLIETATEEAKIDACCTFLEQSAYLGVADQQTLWDTLKPVIDTLFEQAPQPLQEEMINYLDEYKET